MASTGKGKRKQKGKTMDLHSFLRDNQAAPEGFTIVNTSKTWAEAMEDEELDDKFTLDYKKDTPSSTNKVILPTAPKAVRSSAIDESKVPNKPPYKAYLGNLPYEVSEEDIISFFKKLRVKGVQLPREGGRLRGFGYAEFEDRSSLIDALNLNSETLRNRQIRVSLSSGDTDKPRRVDDREDRTAGDWRNAPRDQLPPRDRERDQRFNRDLRNGSDFDQFRGASSYDRRPPQERFDRGFDRNYRQPRDEFERPHDRRNDRYEPRSERRDFGNNFERRRFNEPSHAPSSPSPTPLEESQVPKERPKLNLKPRSVPADATPNAPATNSAIFAGAKPVDTAAREREIEERLLKEKEESEKKDDSDKLSHPASQSPSERSERVRRISNNSNYSGSNRSRRGSETERGDRRSPRESFETHPDREFRSTRRPELGDNSKRDNVYRENRDFRSKGRQEHESNEHREEKGNFRDRDDFRRSGRAEDDEGYHSNYQRSGNHNRNTRGINSGDRAYDSGPQNRKKVIGGRSNFSNKRGGLGSEYRTNSLDSGSQNRASVPKEKSDSRPQSKIIDQNDEKEVEYTSANKYAYLRDDLDDDVDGASH
ncbi:Eukaryotic translation initiation factor 4B-like protein [Leptotrombidium deliense]|uniref:Eukaryotic translation initiation factor 4B-like protein n=1 Tax=Leptotrombidium deliense TaxID=299467 RepID=A0A443SCN4_9ACAR|nr:Eukaryotic translation initiation factor 4B-like protein [Leptotrombidium deliense]